jgi:hypothetical protein
LFYPEFKKNVFISLSAAKRGGVVTLVYSTR